MSAEASEDVKSTIDTGIEGFTYDDLHDVVLSALSASVVVAPKNESIESTIRGPVYAAVKSTCNFKDFLYANKPN